MKKKYQVFVSSTYSDLKDDRQVAVEAILKAGDIPAGMELFSASNESQMDVIKRWIDESDIYMLLLGGRYGSIEPISGKSYTHLEYEYAIEKDKPFFALVMKDALIDERVKEFGTSVLERENLDKYKVFKDAVLSKMCYFYEDSKDIKLGVFETLSDFHRRYTLSGWISGKEFNIDKYVDELNDLRKENKTLNKENNALKENVQSLDHKLQKNEENVMIFSSEPIADRVERILKLGYYEEKKGNMEWEDDENDAICYSMLNVTKKFVPYYVFKTKEADVFRKISFIYIDDGIEQVNLTTIFSGIRLQVEEIPENSDTTFEFIIVSSRISKDVAVDCNNKFDYMVKKSNSDNKDIIFDIWDNDKMNCIESKYGLNFVNCPLQK